MKGIQVCSNQWPCPLYRGDNFELLKTCFPKTLPIIEAETYVEAPLGRVDISVFK